MTDQTRVGPFILEETGERREGEWETTSNVWSRGEARIFTARLTPDVVVELGDITFVTHERDVRMLSRGPM